MVPHTASARYRRVQAAGTCRPRTRQCALPDVSCRILFRTVSLATLLVAALHARAADYIIPGRSLRGLSMLNRYEQPLSEQERTDIEDGAALRIVDTDATLGDGITTAIRVESVGKEYFILPGDDDGDAYVRKAGRIFRGCRVLGDTVVVKPGRSVPLSERYPPAGRTSAVKGGEILALLFEYQGSIYAGLAPGHALRYGWCAKQEGAWEKKEGGASAVQTDTGVSPLPSIIARLEAAVENANATYRTFFTQFNSLTGQNKSAPVWKQAGDPTTVQWELNEPYRRTGQLDRSTSALVQDMSMLLVGTEWRVAYRDGRVRIERADTGKEGGR